MSSTPDIDTPVKALSTHQVVIRIAIIIAVMESLIMLVLESIPHETDAYAEAIADTGLLIIFSIPAIFLWVIKPFVTARDHALARISHLAHVDPLTQLANRRMLSTHLEKAIASMIRHGMYGALLLLDLDGFKPVNDAHGHNVGDALLVEIAARMQSVTRSEDVVARLGGDEFVVLIGYLDVDEQRARYKASLVAENLIELVSKPFDYEGTSLQVGASIGIRLLGTENTDPDTAISQADRAMYQAKQTGRGRAVFFAQ
ncbi:MAG: GGDEF domain-containing protein [Burkholderiales bacterium]|jgi:diguanylate cyclase (GGDEF)-like protein